MKAILRTGFLALAIMALAVPADAGPLEDGAFAHQRGDYATALKIWRPLAEQGHAKAHAGLGFMYRNSDGVPQDYVEAVKWYRMAAEPMKAILRSGLGHPDAPILLRHIDQLMISTAHSDRKTEEN